MRHVRISNDRAVELIDLPDGIDFEKAFHPVIAATIVPYESDVELGWHFDGLQFLPPETGTVALASLKVQLKVSVDTTAETERLKYITPGAGQAMTYQQKMEEVRALAQDAVPDLANYPMLSAEIGVTAATLREVAAVVLAAYQQWQQVGAGIEGLRLRAKAAIDAAETVSAALEAAEVTWPNR